MLLSFFKIQFIKTILLIIILFTPAYLEAKITKENTPFSQKVLYYLYQPITLFLPHIEFRETIYETETQYFNIRIEKDESERLHLVFLPRRGSQSIFDPNNPKNIISNFMKHAFLAPQILEHAPKNVLFIGLGGGIMPRYIRDCYPNTQIDIVEIDPVIPNIAKKYFDFKSDENMKIYIMDGRVFINKAPKKYDLIFMDVYNAENIPFQFTTQEFFEQIKKHLNKDGIFVANIANLGREGFISAELNTIKKVFNKCLVSVCENETNYVPFAFSDDSINIEKIAEKIRAADSPIKNGYNINFIEIYDTVLSPENLKKLIGPSPVTLTDDYAPVNLL